MAELPACCEAAGVGSSRSHAPPAQRCGSSPQRSFARNITRGQVRLDPGMGVGLPHLVELAQGVPLVASVSQDDAGRNALAAEHQGQGGGEVFAMPAGMVGHEILDRVEVRIARLPFQGVLKLVPSGPIAAPAAGRGRSDRRVRGRLRRSIAGPAPPGAAAWPGICSRARRSVGRSLSGCPTPARRTAPAASTRPSTNAVVPKA